MEEQKQSIFDEMTFMDSWKDHSVQLLAGTALVVGTAGLVAKGQTPEVINYGKKAFKNVEKNTDKYLRRRLPKTGKILYPLGKDIFRYVKPELDVLRSKKNDVKSLTRESYLQSIDDKVKKFDPQKVKAKALELKRLEEEQFELKQFGQTKKKPFVPGTDQYYESLAEQSMVEQSNLPPSFNKKQKFFGKDNLKAKFTDTASNVAGAALAGTAFATGISIIHSFDNNPKAKKSYEVAGSFLKDDSQNKQNNNKQRNNRQSNNQYKGYNNMSNNYGTRNQGNYPRPNFEKQSAVRDFHEAVLANPSKKIGGAVLSGLGFGGVSYGMSELRKKQEADKKAPNQNRIIIELGADENDANSRDGGMGLIPRPNFNKQANVKNFIKNVGGRKEELRNIDFKLNNHDYTGEVVQDLQGKNMKTLLKPYNHVLGDEKAKEYFLNQQIHQLKNKDILEKDKIKDSVALAQTQAFTGGAVGLAGLAGLASRRKDEEQ